MSVDQAQLEKAKQAAVKSLTSIKGVKGVGIGDGTLRVYILNDDIKASLPDAVEGVPIETVVTGEIEAY